MFHSIFAPPSRAGINNNNNNNNSSSDQSDTYTSADISDSDWSTHSFNNINNNNSNNNDDDSDESDNCSDSYWSDLDNNNNNNNSDDDDSDSQDNSNENELPWSWPPTEEVLNVIGQLPADDTGRLAWESLLFHDCESTKADPDWYPWRNELCMMLFLCRYDPTFSISRNAIQCFIFILKTLQQNGHLNQRYWIPKHANTVERWWKWLPKPPQSMLSYNKKYCK